MSSVVPDSISTFRFIVRNVANRNGLHATFMPKPIYGINGSGMHTHQSLFANDQNIFFDANGRWQLSELCLNYIGGILRHAKGFCAITNPLVNSYKRLVPGYEAPTNIAWSEKNRSPLVRVPAARGDGTRIELNDSRALSAMSLHAAGEDVLPRLGMEANDRELDADHLRDALSKRNGPIKPALMDQKVLAGLGNIYAAEALWRARISPRARASRCRKSRCCTATRSRSASRASSSSAACRTLPRWPR